MAVLVLLNGPPASGKSTIAQAHHDAAALVDRSEHADPVGQMYDAFIRVLEQRPATRRVEVVPGDIDQTFARFEDALDISTQ